MTVTFVPPASGPMDGDTASNDVRGAAGRCARRAPELDIRVGATSVTRAWQTSNRAAVHSNGVVVVIGVAQQALVRSCTSVLPATGPLAAVTSAGPTRWYSKGSPLRLSATSTVTYPAVWAGARHDTSCSECRVAATMVSFTLHQSRPRIADLSGKCVPVTFSCVPPCTLPFVGVTLIGRHGRS